MVSLRKYGPAILPSKLNNNAIRSSISDNSFVFSTDSWFNGAISMIKFF